MKLQPLYINFERQPLNANWQTFFKNSKAELRKQEEEAKETEKQPEEKEISRSLNEILQAIITRLDQHSEILEALADKIDEISQTQARRPQRQGDFTLTKEEPSERDLAIIESRFEQIGLCGEVRKVLPFTVIGGKLAE